ncbi:MAG TPA: universal stress protein [Candidatus Bathyarchaeia archaeon]|nr:universal stress protein [Candidatus Bathyarchaeia archaeon]
MNSDSLPPSAYRHILFCTDFSENAGLAFDYAVDAAVRRPGSTLYLLHVVPEPDAQFWKTYIYEVEGVDDKAKHDIDAKIAEQYLPRVPQGVDFRVEMQVGRDYLKILEFAHEIKADLIVIGRHGHSALEKVLFGNVTEKVVRKADCPVLVVPLSAKQRTAENPKPEL